MSSAVYTSRSFNQDIAAAKRDARNGPVFITDRGKPAHVLMTYENYQKLVGEHLSIVELLGLPGAADIEFESPKFEDRPESADLS